MDDKGDRGFAHQASPETAFEKLGHLIRAYPGFFTRGPSPSASGGTGQMTWSPAIDVLQRDEYHLVIRAELPGVNKDNVKLVLRDDGLIIQGERSKPHEENREALYGTERTYGQFYRWIPLPERVDPGQVSAEFKNGVLEITVTLPQSQQTSAEVGWGPLVKAEPMTSPALGTALRTGETEVEAAVLLAGIEAIEKVRESTRRDQEEIERLKGETRAILSQLRVE